MPSVASGTEGISAYTQNGRDDLRVVRIAPELIKQRSARRRPLPAMRKSFPTHQRINPLRDKILMPSVASGTEGISAYTQNGRDDLRVVRIAPELIKQRSARRPAPPCNAQEFCKIP